LNNSRFQYFKFVCLVGAFGFMAFGAWRVAEEFQKLHLPQWASIIIALGLFVGVTIFIRVETTRFLLRAYVQSDRAFSALAQSRRVKRRTRRSVRTVHIR
jgi:hypothetical protein